MTNAYTKPGVNLRDLDEVQVNSERWGYEKCILAGLEFLGNKDEFVHLPAEQRIALAIQYANGLSTQVHNRGLQRALNSLTDRATTNTYYEEEARAQVQQSRSMINGMMEMPIDKGTLIKLANINVNEDPYSGEDVQRENDRS